jgi:RNA polymerase sigma-70 factor (ECF subfamily)
VLVSGDLGLLTEVGLPAGSGIRTTTAFAIVDGRLTGVFNQLNPATLSRVPPLGPPPPEG